ncbi:MAG: BON domain-containing protein [Desulfosarcina sp.]|jgi:osmotically-inducible protein OsmY
MQTTRINSKIVVTSFLAIISALCIPLIGLTATIPMVTDTAISDAVEDELFFDTAIRAHLIDVSTQDGIVTLDGVVDNLLAKERAGRIAEMVKGVRAVVNTIRVMPPILRSDKEIKAGVRQALLADPATDSYEVDVTVKDHVVTLSGLVNSWQERELAATVAKGVKGVKGLNNQLTFDYTDSRPDREIAQDIIQTLRWDVLVDHALIDVEVNDGKVTLSGIVGSLAEKHRAIGDAYVANVSEVDAERLEVQGWARDPQLKGDKYKNLSDSDIRDALQDALTLDPRVASFDVAPDVNAGVVTLRGKVDNLKARRAAYQTASNTVGVVRVVNRIKVRLPEMVDDKKLEDRIKDAFIRDPIVESFEITVNVRNGVADLFGSVGTAFERLQAGDLAARVNGIIDVNNYIAVSAAAAPYTFDPFLDDWQYTRDFEPHYGPPYRPIKTDADIEADIQNEFFWSPFVDGDSIHVEVEGGIATLTGTVDSLRESQAATDNAYEGGASVVDNQLIVR